MLLAQVVICVMIDLLPKNKGKWDIKRSVEYGKILRYLWQKIGWAGSITFADGVVCDTCFKAAGFSATSVTTLTLMRGTSVSDFVKMTQPKEYRVKCNACGKLFCYNKEDLKANILYYVSAKSNIRSGARNSIFGSQLVGQGDFAQADRDIANIKDFSRCPQCRSGDLRELTDAEYEIEKASSSKPASATISAADELKKFKELLDMGVISQEEFDVKKKQLLGL